MHIMEGLVAKELGPSSYMNRCCRPSSTCVTDWTFPPEIIARFAQDDVDVGRVEIVRERRAGDAPPHHETIVHSRLVVLVRGGCGRGRRE